MTSGGGLQCSWGSLVDPLPTLNGIVQKKQTKARDWDWRNADERWLIIVGQAQSLDDTMPLKEGMTFDIAPAPAFTRVFAWDGFFERVFEILPNRRVVFEVNEQGEDVIHSRAFPAVLEQFCRSFR